MRKTNKCKLKTCNKICKGTSFCCKEHYSLGMSLLGMKNWKKNGKKYTELTVIGQKAAKDGTDFTPSYFEARRKVKESIK